VHDADGFGVVDGIGVLAGPVGTGVAVCAVHFFVASELPLQTYPAQQFPCVPIVPVHAEGGYLHPAVDVSVGIGVLIPVLHDEFQVAHE